MRPCLILYSILGLFMTGHAQEYKHYFGNLHAHTAFSDGNKDSVSSGVNSPAGSYAYAKLSEDFDFLGISEHNHYSQPRNPGFKRHLYQAGLNMALQATEEERFLALFGMEYGVSSQYNGHVIVYGFDSLIGWEHTVQGVTGPNYDIYNARTDYDGLFRKIKNNPEAFAYLAHPSFSDYTTDGTPATALANAPYNPAYDSALVGLPLRSGKANSSVISYDDYPAGHYFNYYKKLLNLGYHVGIGYDHDNHYTNFGRGNAGRLVILAPALTRTELFRAMKQRRFYGSDDANARVSFHMNGHVMGSVVSGSVYPTFHVLHQDPDGEQADTIRIWKGHRNSGGLWAWIVHEVSGNNTLLYTDQKITPGVEYYYFAEIRQADGHWIVTSPVWYTATALVSVKEPETLPAFRFYPHPVSKKLNLSMEACEEYTLVIADLSGRLCLEQRFWEQQAVIDLSSLAPGVYTMTLRTKTGSVVRKLVLE
jgi:hypothetical protein